MSSPLPGTPLPGTLNHALARAYVEAAREGGCEVRVIDLADDPIPAHPRSRDELRVRRAEIAAALFLGVETVRTHVAKVLTKLGARDRTQAVVIAYRTGLVDPRAE